MTGRGAQQQGADRVPLEATMSGLQPTSAVLEGEVRLLLRTALAGAAPNTSSVRLGRALPYLAAPAIRLLVLTFVTTAGPLRAVRTRAPWRSAL